MSAHGLAPVSLLLHWSESWFASRQNSALGGPAATPPSLKTVTARNAAPTRYVVVACSSTLVLDDHVQRGTTMTRPKLFSDFRQMTVQPVRAAALSVALVAACALPMQAQQSGDGFLFKQPAVSLRLTGGFAHPTASSDLFSFVTDELTLSKNDFNGMTLG